MKFGLALYTNLDQDKTNIINKISQDLENEYSEKDFGDDLKELYIGIICVKPEFDEFFKIRRPKYRQGKKTTTTDGFTITYENCLEYDIKVEFNEFSKLNENAIKKMLSDKILNSLDYLLEIKKPKKIDFITFKKDLESFLSNYK